MRNEQTDPRLDAANLTKEDFIGEIKFGGDLALTDDLVETLQNEESNRWAELDEHELLEPNEGYLLKYNTPNSTHCVYLMHDNLMVGFFHETDTLVIHSSHQGKSLGKELILAAFAQKPWNNPQRIATAAGKKTLKNAYRLAIQAQPCA